MNWIRQYEELLRMRYGRLYGEKDSDEWARKERKKFVSVIPLILILLLAVVINDIQSYEGAYKNVRMKDDGTITGVQRPKGGEGTYSFNTKATIITENGPITKEYYITIEPEGPSGSNKEESAVQQEPEMQQADAELKRLISTLNIDTTQSYIMLPDSLENGSPVIWGRPDNTDVVFYFATALVIIWLLYRSRFHGIQQMEKQARESVVRELPEFINKLVLLLNAGVVLNSAFLKIAEECSMDKKKNDYFYGRMNDIAHMVRETNASFHQELYDFARCSGVKELMRITNILLDNISKGDDLAEKLRRENELLWFTRKQQAEEKGRLAETKLTMPLMILLLVLIIVTIAPALMEI